MKVVQINAVAEYSSTGRSTSELDTALKKHGIESWIAATNVANGEYTIKIGNNFDHKVHALFSRILGRQGYFSILSTKKLVRKLKSIQPDIVHLRNLHANYVNLPVLFEYLLENKVACVVTLHDCWPFTGHCCYFVDTKCDKWKTGCGNCLDRHNWNPSWFFDYSKENLRDKEIYWQSIDRLAVIGVSDWVTDFVPESILKNADIIKRIYNWIDLDLFKPRAENVLQAKLRSEGKPLILGIAQTWNRQKGIYDFIEIAQRNPEWQFLLVGTIGEDINLPENIQIYGATSDTSELVDIYNCADVFFNPSSRETFGKVTAEALACGTPVVGYNVTATPELIPEGCGKVVSEGDLDAVQRALEEILEGPSLRNNCREFAYSAFDKEKLVAEYINVYSILAQHP